MSKIDLKMFPDKKSRTKTTAISPSNSFQSYHSYQTARVNRECGTHTLTRIKGNECGLKKDEKRTKVDVSATKTT